MKNMILAYPSDWFVTPETLKLVKESFGAIDDFYKKEATEELAPTALKNIISEPLHDCYTIPLFSETFCKLLLDEVKNHGFMPNDEEDVLRQMPEVVLSENIPALYHSLFSIVNLVLNPIFMVLWNRHVNSGNIQVANYNPKDKKQGAWHHDRSGDITVVVPLNTGEYEGGGTEFHGRGAIEPLPTGTALIFPSFTHMHRGLPVQKGDRYLLVFWLKYEEL